MLLFWGPLVLSSDPEKRATRKLRKLCHRKASAWALRKRARMLRKSGDVLGKSARMLEKSGDVDVSR